jgi:hypothetical protein
MNKVWNKRQNNYTLSDVTDQITYLKPAIYKLCFNEQTGVLYLSKTQDCFTFPYKIYGCEQPFIDRVVKSYNNTKGNFGVLLNGLRGTGKTITAELICNKLNLPVIIVSEAYQGFASFLNEIQQDIIVFIDEFEKIYDEHDNSLLTIMDGVLKTNNRILFLLTTNHIRIEKNLLQRPSRIRYVKTFSDLDLNVIIEVVDDLLINKSFRQDVIKFISERPIITMDIVKAIIEEVNIHDESTDNFKLIFNVNGDTSDIFNVYEVIDGQKQLLFNATRVSHSYFNDYTIGEHFYAGRQRFGVILDIVSSNTIVVENDSESQSALSRLAGKEAKNKEKENESNKKILLLEPVAVTHSIFKDNLDLIL